MRLLFLSRVGKFPGETVLAPGSAKAPPSVAVSERKPMAVTNCSPGGAHDACRRTLTLKERGKGHALGLTSATGLVNRQHRGDRGVPPCLPSLAGAGTMGIAVLAVIAVGAMLLAVLFGQLTKRVPNSDGGLYAYSPARVRRLRRLPRGLVLLGSSPWAGNAAIVASWVFYVDALFGWAHNTGMENWTIAMVGLWVPAIINLVGVRPDGVVPEHHRRLKFLPLLFVGVIGWFFVTSANFGPFNATGGSLYSGIGIARGRGALSFNRGRGGGDHGQASQGPSPQRECARR